MHPFATLTGHSVEISAEALSTLASSLQGDLLTPGSSEYDEARSIWNGMIDRHPAAVARCRNPQDVAEAVRFARAHDLRITVKGAGHNIAGNAVADGALMVDLSGMKGVEVDAAGRTARVEPGCTLADVDAATQKHALAVPTGINSTTGISGLTLGGGFGWLSRKHGLTVDNLLSAEVVTATGERVTASATENPGLFWGIRGGGGNFGIVTAFNFQLHPLGPEVFSGLVVHPFDDAMTVLKGWRDFARQAPDELTVWVVMRKAPPLPFLPESWHGKEVVILAGHWAGDPNDGERAFQPLRQMGSPIADVMGLHPYAGWQQAFDPLLAPGARNYWKTHNFHDLSDAALETMVRFAGQLPTPHCEVFLAQMGGAISRVPAGDTAYVGREIPFLMNIHGRWEDPAEDDAGVGWTRGLFDALTPHAAGTAYVNFMPQDESARVPAAYGENYERLREVKTAWDPENVFRFNQNIPPKG